MSKIQLSIIHDENEIEILRGRTSFNYTYDESTIDLLKKNFSLKDSLYLLAREDEKFVAFCSIDRDWWEDNYFFIREILVDPEFQNQGIGEEIMSRCVAHAGAKGAIGVATETAFKNIAMQKMCEKFHFAIWENPRWKEGFTYKLNF
jgi:ribosomal protein S18 acetylase RimI-like enzyme